MTSRSKRCRHHWLASLDNPPQCQNCGFRPLAEIERLERALSSAECVVRQVARDTFGKDMTVKEFADASSYDS